ncbi:hypothetical protein EHM76_07150 [bacterium]|nr:MAG: hypothetical protein EHM76_07150 [bacterium]
MLVQVRRPTQAGGPGAIFVLNTSGHTLQRSYSLANLGIKDPVYLCSWENSSSSEDRVAAISVTLPGHHSALYFFSDDPIGDIPIRLPS